MRRLRRYGTMAEEPHRMDALENEEPDIDDLGPSRSQQRRDALAVLALAEQLVALPPNRLDQIELPEDVRNEIAQVRRIKSHGARKRQLAFLAKLMRRHDDDVFASAHAAMGENQELRRQENAALQRLETLRERLLDDGDAALGEFIARYPDVDRQQLRTLVRQARMERLGNKPLRAYRELFRLLRTIADADPDD
ncbi:ribosome biogenesis factor YjgA [Oleiagrimonas sp.]|uniref:ribosome biogenesis factor YjgA n=1 Tax=Oleiagrimonas sp. TaxID=2010330 RepID=UPI0031BB0669